jgi:very-short-patch-repair endonuclease
MKPRTKKQCSKCNKYFSLSNFNKHFNVCVGILKEHVKVNENWKQKNGKYKCPICGKEYTKNGISSHIIFKHINPINNKKNGFTSYNQKIKNGEIKHWAKGLTKETSNIIKKMSDTLTKKYKSGEIISPFKNKKHTDISCKKMSESAIESFKNGTHATWKSRKIQSYPEKYFESVLKNLCILDKSSKEYYIKPYFLDFYFTEKKIDLEIDGSQHKNRIESDKRRDEYLTSLGIKVFRINWKNPKAKDGNDYLKNKIKEFIKLYNNVLLVLVVA